MDYEAFKKEFENLSGICLDYYKEKQMKRRTNTLISRKGLEGYDAFVSLMKSDPNELAAYVNYITINVTEFFRTPDHWKCFEEEVLSLLVNERKDKLKVWSCACSTGEEPYSLAVSLCSMTDPDKFQIIATDVDDCALAKAQEGLYSIKEVEQLSDETLEKFFTRRDLDWAINDEIKSCVEFRKLDLLKDPYPQDCDLIVCRNVLIYFTDEAKRMIYLQFKDSMKQYGYLFTGNAEQIVYYKNFGLKKLHGYLYQNC